MIATLVRAALTLSVSLALVGWQAGWRGTKPGSAGLGEVILILCALLGANVASVVITSTLLGPLLPAIPGDGWAAVPGEIAIRSTIVISGVWSASILCQCAQNIGRSWYGAPLEPIEWVNLPNKARPKKRRRKS